MVYQGQGCDPAKCILCSGNTCYSCKNGYFRSGGNCIRCTYLGCNTCSNSNSCDTCTPGYWEQTCNSACSAGCVGSGCDINDGYCTCRSGYYGSICVHSCSKNCVNNTCSLANGSCQCGEGHYGARCENMCMASCQDCIDGIQCTVCPVGRYRPTCTFICNCNSVSCDMKTGVMNNLGVRHSASRVLTLDSARPVRRVTMALSVVRHALVAVMVDVM